MTTGPLQISTKIGIDSRELVDDDFLDVLKDCQEVSRANLNPNEPTHYVLKRPVKELWDALLNDVYPDYYAVEKPDIDAWHRVYLPVLKAGKSILRNTGSDMFYQRTGAIPDMDKQIFYSAMKLPGRPDTGNYKPNVFDYAVEQVMKGWDGFLNALSDPAAYASFAARLENADLDTGTADGVDYVMWKGGKTSDWRIA